VTWFPQGGVPPFAASRSPGAGDGIDYYMDGGGVPPGSSSAWLIVDTDAPSLANSIVSFQGVGDSSGGLPAFGPDPPGPAPAPEPATLTLALVGLPLAGAFGYYRRLRRGKPA
jgi:hypothetical protein